MDGKCPKCTRDADSTTYSGFLKCVVRTDIEGKKENNSTIFFNTLKRLVGEHISENPDNMSLLLTLVGKLPIVFKGAINDGKVTFNSL